MSERDIIQNMISELGQSQDERLPDELRGHFVDVDERTPAELLLFVKKLAGFVKYYRGDVDAAKGNWSSFFPYLDDKAAARLVEDSSGTTPAHLALLIAFLELYKRPCSVINQITERHVDFFYRRVLGFESQTPVADRVHLLIELKKNVAPVRITPAHLFSAGKDQTGVEQVYAPVRETLIGPAKIDSLRSIYVDGRRQGTVRFAPIANSSDGVGGELSGDEPKWNAFGHNALPAGEVGFAIASPVLRMVEGRRKVILFLSLEGVETSGLRGTAASSAFQGFITGEKSWLGPFLLRVHIPDDPKDLARIELDVPATEKAVVDYNAAIHGYAYTARAPILQILLRPDHPTIGYKDVKDVIVTKAQVSVEVDDITSLVLESDAGKLDPKKAFLPFGPQPAVGSRFMIGYAEALSKKLSEVTLKIRWQGMPADFASHYADYGESRVDDRDFTALVALPGGKAWEERREGGSRGTSRITLFVPPEVAQAETVDRPRGERVLTLVPGTRSKAASIESSEKLYALAHAGNVWGRDAAVKFMREKPVLAAAATAAPEAPSGFITLFLERDLLHVTYRKKTIENALAFGKSSAKTPTVLNEPYTPAIQSISLSYKAYSDNVHLGSNSLDDFCNQDVQFFHVGCFGQMQEHSYQRWQFDFVDNKKVPLVPSYPDEGELLLGIRDLRAGDSISVLFQVAEGSADPNAERQPVTWSVLCDNYWRALGSRGVILDTTRVLLTSGLMTFVIPREATTQNTILPGGYIWLKAAVSDQVHAVCQFIRVAENAVEAEFRDNGNDPAHLRSSLPEGKISKLKTPIAAVKAVRQPYASFGGRPEESRDALYKRTSERLRHKNRCLTAWDYERIVLGAFSGVHQVKCIPHAKDTAWLAPGHVLLIVIPNLRNKNATNPLEPKVDADTMSRIKAHVQARAGMQVEVDVKNPRYQKMRLEFKVKFMTDEFNYYSVRLEQDLIRFLSPWAYDATRRISFGGCIYKSVLLDFVEELDYVDYVTDFKLFTYCTDRDKTDQDLNEVRPWTPDSLLVSDSTHSIEQAP